MLQRSQRRWKYRLARARIIARRFRRPPRPSLQRMDSQGSTLSANCPGSIGMGLTLMVNNPPCYQGTSDPNTGKANYAEVVASENVQTYFAGLLGFLNVPISARAEAVHPPRIRIVFTHWIPPGGTQLPSILHSDPLPATSWMNRTPRTRSLLQSHRIESSAPESRSCRRE